MEHVAALMLILGCSEYSTECKRADLPEMRYESVDACEAAIERRLLNSGIDFPVIVGQCIEVDPAVNADWKVVWNMESSGQLNTRAIPVGIESGYSRIEVASR